MSDDKRVDVEFGAKIAGLVAGAREAAAVVKRVDDRDEGARRGPRARLRGCAGALGRAARVVAGGALFKEAISTVEWTARS
jgi:hypothetical protein